MKNLREHSNKDAAGDPIGGERRDMRRRALTALGVLVAVTVAAVVAILVYAGSEGDRLRQEWEVRLGIVADSRKSAVEGWLDQRQGDVLRIASNRAIQFFLIDQADPDVPAEAVDARLRYIEDLLAGEAIRGGFSDETGGIVGGLILREAGGGLVAGSPGSPSAESAPLEAVAGAGRAVISPMFDAGGGVPMIAVTAPVIAVEGAVGGEPIGYLTGFLRLEDGFFALLRQPGDVAGDTASQLLQGQGTDVQAISPDMSSAGAVGGGYASALAGQSRGAGTFTGPTGAEVLAVSRLIRDTGWTLVRLIDRDTALADGQRRIWMMVGICCWPCCLPGLALSPSGGTLSATVWPRQRAICPRHWPIRIASVTCCSV